MLCLSIVAGSIWGQYLLDIGASGLFDINLDFRGFMFREPMYSSLVQVSIRA